MKYIWIPLVALTAACSQSERTTTGPSAATGTRAQAFSIADQPPIGDCAISRPSDAPTELRAAQGGASVVTLEARPGCNQTRWQFEVTRHDPSDQPFALSHTADGKPVFAWRFDPALVGRTFNWRVRAAWPDGAVGAWVTGEPFTVSAAPVVSVPVVRPPANGFDWAKRDCEALGGVYDANACTLPEQSQPNPVE